MVSDMKTFVCRYYHKGSWWALNITAADWTDANDRAAKLGNLQVLGELHASIPANVLAAGLIVRLWTALMNFIKA